MIRIQLLGISVVLTLTCYGQTVKSFSKIKKCHVVNYYPEYKAFCSGDTANYELAAVSCSFFGEYRQAIYFATKDAARRGRISAASTQNNDDLVKIIDGLNRVIQDPTSSQKSIIFSKKLLSIYTRPGTNKDLFAHTKMFKASDLIIKEAKKYHFVLINEAHYNSPNRAFTQSLLKPLWDQGYRYLALETLREDSVINKLGFPITKSGYYFKDATFGNLLREALKTGYKLVSYESKPTLFGSERDNEQAINLYTKTWQQDTLGKVLVHAGYSHIFEFAAPSYHPMGARLSELIGRDVLSIDQVTMRSLLNKEYNHGYYNFVNDSIGFDEPIAFTDTTGHNGLIDPVNALGIDFQVYTPLVKFTKDRPDWLFTAVNKEIDLPMSFNKYFGCLIQAIPYGESDNAVPVDQMIFKPGKVFLLPSGKFSIYIIDNHGSLVGTSILNIN